MKVISGLVKGHKLYPIDKLNIRPTLGHIKESIFNMIMFRVENCFFLDLCSGSGAIGIEALSRGSKKVFFVEKNMACVKLIKKNLEITKLDKRNNFKIICGDAREVVKGLAQQKIFFDIIFLDPPYYKNISQEILIIIGEKNLLREDGIIICETGIDEDLPDINTFDFYRYKKYGNCKINFIRRKK
ncbi:MAG: 16S rRNA (guanine(966)-N(2))-methyltransferase RsmD [Firmicutes bacterium]|nr:16S rRNA (guanine(966)-N(2))-methyltransferase RsmD [Bacillota bacterium]